MTAEYAMYKGEDLLCIGTLEELAEFRGVQRETIYWYTMPTYQKRIAKRKNARNYVTVEKLEDDL